MKTIMSSKFGALNYQEEDIIKFEKGIPGFEDEHQFIIVKQETETPFAIFQSVKTADLSFIIADPFAFYQEYEFDLDEQTKAEMLIEEVSDIAVWGLLSIPKDFQHATINLKAPLIINAKNKQAKQVILHEYHYLTKNPIFPDRKEKGGK